ncbi:expressed unknown protein [Seminavis robusta]|uniref:Uncharacterized protein n=1 Tax=Seminavis robusta TaxID=568900 RepID=A0A9N8DKE7_9STRA|nr:expressed unknown protein [Seminavis robusta]|eukprot:Sro129_g061520.1 n/a (216) ;mRNA; f:40129-40776
MISPERLSANIANSGIVQDNKLKNNNNSKITMTQQRITPTTMTSSMKKKNATQRTAARRRVHFDDSAVATVVLIDKISQDAKGRVWYNKTELNDSYDEELMEMQQCSERCFHKHATSKCEQHTIRGLESNICLPVYPSHKHVRHVMTFYRIQLKQHKGDWDPQGLRRASKFASKEHRREAVKRGKKDHMDATKDDGNNESKGRFTTLMKRVATAW